MTKNRFKPGKPSKLSTQKKIFYVLVIMVFFLGSLNLAKAKGYLIPSQPVLEIKGKTIDLDTLTLEQKIAQMVIVAGLKDNYWAWRNMQVGGIHLFALQNSHIFNNTIIDFQYQMPIPFFVTADLEGCVSPFDSIRQFTPASEIKTIEEAFQKGMEEGQFLHQLGFNLNFAPVVDLQDEIWKCRSFLGNESNIAQLGQAYLTGLQSQQILGTAKHYPGKTLVVKDPHKFIVAAEISQKDIYPYKFLVEQGEVRAIMVSHLITSGEVPSQGVPSVVSKKVIDDLRKSFPGLVISDEIHMLGLKKFYPSLEEMYLAVFKAGNDLILNFDRDPNEIHHMITVVKEAVNRGEIPEEQIDNSVRKILEAKGFRVRD
ncbi:glycoside hydrolase family 3 protein [Candidatus Woesearchaeota archaeon]|nr:glycoside hydrolase family 3 protein [Candidatus Woesearchaeota archaeon]